MNNKLQSPSSVWALVVYGIVAATVLVYIANHRLRKSKVIAVLMMAILVLVCTAAVVFVAAH